MFVVRGLLSVRLSSVSALASRFDWSTRPAWGGLTKIHNELKGKKRAALLIRCQEKFKRDKNTTAPLREAISRQGYNCQRQTVNCKPSTVNCKL